MVWFGTIVAVVLQTAFLSPPVAMSAYYLKQVVKNWSLADIYRGMADFMVIQVLCVVLVLVFPKIAMWFPDWLEEGDRMAVPLQVDDKEEGVDNHALEAGDAMQPSEKDEETAPSR
jgi:hypothetical protein